MIRRAGLLGILLGVWFSLGLAGCASRTSRVRVQVSLSPDASAAASGPLELSMYSVRGLIIDAAALRGTLPGDVVVLVDDDAMRVRIFAQVTLGDGSKVAGVAAGAIVVGREALIPMVLSTAPLMDSDGDGVPDEIDDCPSTPDPAQNDVCEQAVDLAGVDQLLPACGDGVIEADEACDDGAANSDAPGDKATCTTRCQKRVACGTLELSTTSLIDPASGHCYVVWPGPLDFTEGEADCLSRGGHLAALTSAPENTLVSQHLVGETWIGLITQAATDPAWTTHETGGYNAYAPGEPMRTNGSCVASSPDGSWRDHDCGWSSSGNLPPSVALTLPYVCEHSCGNGIVDPGEACDPPGPTCTPTCRKIRACTEPRGQTSPATGACYFEVEMTGSYANALANACPSGTHLATPADPIETATALKALDQDSWMALSAQTQVGQFSFDVPGFTFDPSRYHGFGFGDPDETVAPACTVITFEDARGDSWRDRDCVGPFAAVCERD